MGQIMYMRKGDVHTAPSFFPSIGTALNDFTWEQIRSISDDGTAANYFSVGDTKTIVIDGTVGNTTFSNLEIDVFILGIDHNASVEGSNRIHFSIGKVNGLDVALYDNKYGTNASTFSGGYFSMHLNMNNTGGWKGSNMRGDILGNNATPVSPTANTLMAALPSDLRAVMKSVTKYSDNTGGESGLSKDVTATTDYLWLLAEFEVFGTRKKANLYEKNYQKQYDYYKAGNSKARRKYNNTGSTISWWTRSINAVHAKEHDHFVHVRYTEENATVSANHSLGSAPSFAV